MATLSKTVDGIDQKLGSNSNELFRTVRLQDGRGNQSSTYHSDNNKECDSGLQAHFRLLLLPLRARLQ